MKGQWAYWPELLDDESCDSIIESALKLPAEAATIGVNRTVASPTVRSSEVRWIQHEHRDFVGLFQFIDHHFASANRDFFGVDAVYTAHLQFTTYRESRKGHYMWHEDVAWGSGAVYDRKLSLVLQLSDPKDYEGGDLELDLHVPPPADILRKRGTLLVFPSLVHHRVTPVTSGVRHSLVTWQEGPPWR